ncbi:MAG: DoxX family protein [Terriglobales bacterium]
MSNGTDLLRSWGITLLRVTVGVVFVAHGGQKFFMGFHEVAEMLGSLGIPQPTAAAILLTAVEFFGGLAMIFGILTRYVAVMLAFDMSVAIIMFHWRNGFFAPQNGIEFPLLLLVANLTLILAGGGAAELYRF